MRYVTVDNLKFGMQLAEPLYMHDRLWAHAGLKIDVKLQAKMVLCGFSGCYVSDDVSTGIEIKPLIKTSLKQEMVSTIKVLFDPSLSDGNGIIKAKENAAFYKLSGQLLDDIVDSIYDQADSAVYDIIDLKSYDDYTYYHSINVATLSILLGIEIGYTKDQLKELATAALLHDIGKKFIPISILNKTSPLEEKEKDLLKNHPSVGRSYVRSIYPGLSSRILAGIYQHHERVDGSGYPDGVKGDKIHEYAKIIAIADCYDAFTSARPYHPARLPSEGIEFISANQGLDNRLVTAFVHKIAAYPAGTIVILSTGEDAIVVKNRPGYSSRPMVRTIVDSRVIDMTRDLTSLNITIVGITERDGKNDIIKCG